MDTYVATPTGKNAIPSTAILFLTDVLGHRFENAQLLADQYAANGYLTYMPDLFFGDAIPLNRPKDFDIQKWLKGAAGGGEGEGHMVERTEPVVKDFLKFIQGEGIKKIGAVGYCFGAKYVVRGMAKGGGIDVGYIAHPSFVDADELKAITGGLSIAAAGEFPTLLV